MKRDLIHKISNITGISDLIIRHLDDFTFEVSACGSYQGEELLLVLSNYGERSINDDRYIINVGKDIVLEFDNNLDQAVDEFAKLVLAMRRGDLVIESPKKFGPIRIGGKVLIR